MSNQTAIRKALAATLLSFAILPVARFAGAQSGSISPRPEAALDSLALLPAEQMTPADRAAAQSWQPTIASSAQFYGYAVDSSYSYRQIACPVAPNALLLAYESTSPNGLISRFTALVSRTAEEETAVRRPGAQIIPILHFGIVPFIPAIANPHSIEVFNSGVSLAPSAVQVLSAAQAGDQPLLVRALCYLAMVGEESAALASPSSDQATIHAPIRTLVFQNKGRIRQQVSILGSQNSYQVWALTFQSGGKLLSATREEHSVDRTPVVLNAANSGAPSISTRPTVAPSSNSQIPAQPVMPMPLTASPAATTAAASPVAAAQSITPTVVPPAPPKSIPAVATTVPTPPTPPATQPAVEPPTPPPSTSIEPGEAATKSELAPTTPPARSLAPLTAPMTTPLAAPPALTATPASASALPPPTSAPPPPAPEPSAAVSLTPQPPAASANPAPIPPPASAATQAPSAAFVATPPVVKPSPPLPPGRLISHPPPPPSRFIPDSALKTPPHLPQ
jgi:hypothetical protein